MLWAWLYGGSEKQSHLTLIKGPQNRNPKCMETLVKLPYSSNRETCVPWAAWTLSGDSRHFRWPWYMSIYLYRCIYIYIRICMLVFLFRFIFTFTFMYIHRHMCCEWIYTSYAVNHTPISYICNVSYITRNTGYVQICVCSVYSAYIYNTYVCLLGYMDRLYYYFLKVCDTPW